MYLKTLLLLLISLSLLSACSDGKVQKLTQSEPELVSETMQSQSKADSFILSSKSKSVSPSAVSLLDTKEYNWYFKVKPNGAVPDGPDDNSYYKNAPDCSYIGDSSKKELFLTFDQGYENGYTPRILDILKKHSIKAAFFCVKPYIVTNPEIVKRMTAEGHLVCNHSAHHPSMASISELKAFENELTEVSKEYEKLTGQKMAEFFRPPMGKYSERSLKFTRDCGYKTIFWSLAYLDWEVDKQPEPSYAKKKLLDRIHNGAIILLHSVSKTNTVILDELLTTLERDGYVFKTLYDL